jgi:Zn-dependent peptidase ImmA (M78 family)
MPLSRMELQERGAGSPEGLVTRILKLEPNLPIPVPIEDLCKELDISDIRPLDTQGFEGGIITDTERNEGVILVNTASHYYRRRFTIGHELGHFLIPTHMPNAEGRFLCSREDMNLLSANESDRRAEMEVEANRFASLLLIPPPALRKALGRSAADLGKLVKLADDFKVSKQAMSRAYADYHEELIAVIGIKDGRIIWIAKNRMRFPFLEPNIGDAVPRSSLFHRGNDQPNVASAITECLPDHWINVTRGTRAPALYEQVYRQRDGYALLMLQLEQVADDEEDEDEDRDVERRWARPRFSR